MFSASAITAKNSRRKFVFFFANEKAGINFQKGVYNRNILRIIKIYKPDVELKEFDENCLSSVFFLQAVCQPLQAQWYCTSNKHRSVLL